MRRTAAKATSVRRETSAVKKAPDLGALRQRITSQVASKAPVMVKAALEDAEKKVNIGAMKFLFEMIGLYPVRAGEERTCEKPDLVDMLLKKMGLPTEPLMNEEEAPAGTDRMSSE